MQILEAQDVDLISPFPLSEIRRMYGWTKAYKSLTEADFSPHTWEEFEAYTKAQLGAVASWGVIDKNHKTNDRHPAPLIGVVMFERSSPNNGYLHTSTTRRAWGTQLIDQALRRVIEELFNDELLLRVSALMLQKNHLAQSLAKRIGMHFEGIFRDMVTQNQQPKNMVHFGLTKGEWQICRNSSPSQLESEAPSSEDFPKAENKEPSTPTQSEP